MIDWRQIKYFHPSIDFFPENPDIHADEKLIKNLDKFRSILGRSISPSPVPGALARFDGSSTSRHYAVGRKSDAIDIFCNADASMTFIKAISCGLWGGVGVYLDTQYNGKQHVMFHLDCRPVKDLPLIWFRENGKYTYLADSRKYKIIMGKLIGR